MSVALALACREMRLMPEEAIAAATINGACAMGRQRTLGSIEPGKQADLAVFDVSDYREIPFFLGMNLCILTMKQGRIVSRTRAPGSGLPAPRASRRAPTR
jgi:imidazolonepropionase